jgi:RNA polymerase sigma factor (sigma-70 family)
MSALFESLPLPHDRNCRSGLEAILAKGIAKGNEGDLNELVMRNMREAFLYTRGMARSLDEGALISVCYEALMRNAKRFDPARQRFFAFAKAGLRGAIYRNYNKAKAGHPAKGVQCKPVGERTHVHRDPAIVSPLEAMQDYEQVSPENVIESDMEGIFTRDRWELVKPIVAQKCSEQEKMVLTLTYESGLNFQEQGDLLGVTRSAIQRTHWRAVKKLRTELTRRKQLFT